MKIVIIILLTVISTASPLAFAAIFQINSIENEVIGNFTMSRLVLQKTGDASDTPSPQFCFHVGSCSLQRYIGVCEKPDPGSNECRRFIAVTDVNPLDALNLTVAAQQLIAAGKLSEHQISQLVTTQQLSQRLLVDEFFGASVGGHFRTVTFARMNNDRPGCLQLIFTNQSYNFLQNVAGGDCVLFSEVPNQCYIEPENINIDFGTVDNVHSLLDTRYISLKCIRPANVRVRLSEPGFSLAAPDGASAFVILKLAGQDLSNGSVASISVPDEFEKRVYLHTQVLGNNGQTPGVYTGSAVLIMEIE